jgi:hypothetical protein
MYVLQLHLYPVAPAAAETNQMDANGPVRRVEGSRLLTLRRVRNYFSLIGEMRNAYGMLVGNSEGKRPLGRPRRRWYGPVAGCCEHGNEPTSSIKGGEFLD